MCRVSEHRDLKNKLDEALSRNVLLTEQIASLKTRISELETSGAFPEKPTITTMTMDAAHVRGEIRAQDIELVRSLLDSQYQYTTAEGWMEVWSYIYFVFPWPSYTRQFFDCDGFAALAWSLAQAFFNLNYCALTIGTAPMGSHAFIVYRDDVEWMCLEPQSGQFFDWGERGYTPQEVLM